MIASKYPVRALVHLTGFLILVSVLTNNSVEGAAAARMTEITAGENFGPYEKVRLTASKKVKRAAPVKKNGPPAPGADLMSEHMDAEIVNQLGDANIGRGHSVMDRKRRDHAAQKFHEQRAESDSIAAAAEAAAAEADAVAAAVETSEAMEDGSKRGKGHHHKNHNNLDNSITFDDNGNGDLLTLEDDSREREHLNYARKRAKAIANGNLIPVNDPREHGKHSKHQEFLKAVKEGTIVETKDPRLQGFRNKDLEEKRRKAVAEGNLVEVDDPRKHDLSPTEKRRKAIAEGKLIEVEDPRQQGSQKKESLEEKRRKAIAAGTLIEVEDPRKHDHSKESLAEKRRKAIEEGKLVEIDDPRQQGFNNGESLEEKRRKAIEEGQLIEVADPRARQHELEALHTKERAKQNLLHAIADGKLAERAGTQVAESQGNNDAEENDYVEEPEFEGSSDSGEGQDQGDENNENEDEEQEEDGDDGNAEENNGPEESGDEETPSDLVHGIDTSSSNLITEMNDHPDIQRPIGKLLEQSKDLAHEIRVMFQVLAKREDYLVSEMEKLKRALVNAIRMLQDTNAVTKLIRKKRYDNYVNTPNDPLPPYKACVYISPPEYYPPPPIVNTFEQPEQLVQEPPTTTEAPVYEQCENVNDIDLSSVYWLKLAQENPEEALDRIQGVLANLQTCDRDLLIIPVAKGFTSQEDLARGFLRAVRVTPAVTKTGRKKKLRVRVRRI